MKILFLSTYPLHKGPSQRFRIAQYISRLEQAGHECSYVPFYTEEDYHRLYSKGRFLQKAIALIPAYFRRFLLLFRLGRWDDVFIQREVTPLGPPLLAFYISKILRKRLIYDLDDAIWIPNYTDENALFHRLKAYWKTRSTMRWADVVVAGNDFLASYARGYCKDVRVIPTVVDTERRYVRNSRPTRGDLKKVVIGWTGSTSTIQHLETIVNVLQEVQEDHQVELRIIANKSPEFPGIDFKFIPWSESDEIEELSKFDIGLMPLPDSEWTRGKCGFKAIQYMALAIPTIASPVGMNSSLVTHMENGILSASQEQWKEAIISLVDDIDLRQRLGNAGRETIVKRFSLQAHEESFLALFR